MKPHCMRADFGNGMKKKKKKSIKRKCIICGEPYKPVVNTQKACSEKCSHVLKLESQRKYREKKKIYLEKRPCSYCKGIFRPVRKDNRFCSIVCSNASRYHPVILPLMPCAECGKKFKPRNQLAKVCSPECRYVYEKRRAVVRGKIKRMPFSLPDKKCAVCNVIFKPKSSAQKYCSGSCNTDAAKARERILQQSQPIRQRNCLHCQELFTPPTRKSMAKFCGQSCRNKYQATQRQVEIARLEEEQKNLEKLQQKWNEASVQVRVCPADSAYQREIWAFLKQGKTITRYVHPVWAAGAIVDEDEELFEL